MVNDEQFQSNIVSVGRDVLDMISKYFKNDLKDEDSEKVDRAFKFLPQAVKVMHMNQHKTLQERSQAIRLLPYLKDAETREKYIKMTQPSTAALLESRPR